MSQAEKKEKVIHTRIPAALEEQIKRLAEGLRVPVSNLVRNMLEDAIEMTRRVRDHMPGQTPNRAGKNPLDQVFAWQDLTLNKETPCGRCSTTLAAGQQAFLGMTDSPQDGRTFICSDCVPKPESNNNSKKKQRRKP